ncbi:hypothetical protein [Aquimarina gracilis]
MGTFYLEPCSNIPSLFPTKDYTTESMRIGVMARGQIDPWFYRSTIFSFTVKFYSSGGDRKQRSPSFFVEQSQNIKDACNALGQKDLLSGQKGLLLGLIRLNLDPGR